MFGGLIAGVGLLFLGEWSLVLLGIGWMILSPFAISIAMLPAMAFMPLADWAMRRESLPMLIAASIPNVLWTYFLVAASSIYIFSMVASLPEAGFFHWLWAYALVTAPWSFLARKDAEAGNDAGATVSFFVQIGAIAMIVACWLEPSDTDMERLAYWFLPVLGLGLVAQLLLVWVDTRTRRHEF
ncbi:hypothetical protein [Alteriqipengyuania sp.]